MAGGGGRYGTKPAAWAGIVVVLLALVPAVMRVVDGRAGWPEALFILAGAGFITVHATRLVLLHRTGRNPGVGVGSVRRAGGEEYDGGPR